MSDSHSIRAFMQILFDQYQKSTGVGYPNKKEGSPQKMLNNIISYYEYLLDKMPGYIYWVDQEVRILGCNQYMAKLYGLESPKQLVGQSLKTIMQSIRRDSLEKINNIVHDFLRIFSTSQPELQINESLLLANQVKKFFVTHRFPILDSFDNVIGVLNISIDVSHHKKTCNQVRQAKQLSIKRIKEFLDNMRHDLRTPLSGIIGLSEMIKNHSNDALIQDYANSIFLSGRILLNFLNNILDSISLRLKNNPLSQISFNLMERAMNMIHLCDAQAKQKNISVILQADKDIPLYLLGDMYRLDRILLELMTNAIKFTEKGQVNIILQVLKNTKYKMIIKIIIEDTGIGMSTEEQKNIFIPFQRGTPSYYGLYLGMGIGLSIVKQLVCELDGEIQVDSQKNVGTKWILFLPLKKSLRVENIAVNNNQLITISPFHKKRKINSISNATDNEKMQKSYILLVEDHVISAKILKAMLESLHCWINCAYRCFRQVRLFKSRYASSPD